MEDSLKYEIETKIFDLSLLIDEYVTKYNNNFDTEASIIEDYSTTKLFTKSELTCLINKNIVEIDTLIKEIPLSKELNQLYINCKLQYLEKYTDARTYSSVRKSSKLDQIYADTNEIAEINRYIQSIVEKDNEAVDELLCKMNENEEELINTRHELINARDRTISRNRIWNIIYFVCLCFLGYKIIKLFK